ncbi:MAG: lytic transglycosylase domain-containing protein [Thermaurantiacus sp.]|nr:lytic transglycosylase domain-containing protein [Thermaurantiacus sp.]
MAALVALASGGSVPSTSAVEAAWLAQVFRGHDAGTVGPPPAGAPSELARALAFWDWLRRPPRGPEDVLPLAVVQPFLAVYGDWPGMADVRRRAEAQAADLALTPNAVARAWFRAIPPEGAAGRGRLALLLADEPGREAEARALARRAWVAGPLPEPIETALLARFGPEFTRGHHAERIDQLLWAGQVTAARRLLPLLADDERALAEARIALRTGAADAEARAASVPARFRDHAGLVHDRSLWLERARRLEDAEALLAGVRVDPATVTAPRTWLQRRLALARAAWRRGDPRRAERILAAHRAVPEGPEPGTLPLGVRQDLSEVEWLAGFLALRHNGRPDAAVEHFIRFGRIVQTPVSQARGAYWLGRAEQARGNAVAARAAFTQAARFWDSFYGQLAAEALGRAPALPRPVPTNATDADRRAVEGLAVTQAASLLGRMGEGARQSAFVRAVAQAAKTPGLRQAAAELGRRLGRPDLAVWIWREHRPVDEPALLEAAYPRLGASAPVPPDRWIFAHAVARQESSFDPYAVSPAGARGLMQLMPTTAADVARRLGLPFDVDRLTQDPDYNLRLGAAYLGWRHDGLGSFVLAAAAYNAGIGRVRQWLQALGDPRLPAEAGGVDPVDWIEAIPIAETRTYVQRVVENAVVYSLLMPGRADARPRPSAWLR